MRNLKYENSIGRMFNIVSIEHYLIAIVDYLWVITLYVICAFILAITVDGYIFPKFEKEKIDEESSIILFFKILSQLCMQGFIAILLIILLHRIPSPVNGILGYNANSSLGTLVRNPAIISVILFSLSASLKERLLALYGRFVKKSSVAEPYMGPAL